jgi:hypothetical protein
MKPDQVDMASMQARLNALELEVARLNERMRTVGFALIGMVPAIATAEIATPVKSPANGSDSGSAAPKPAKSDAKAPKPAPAPAPAVTARNANKTGKSKAGANGNKWFKPGEATQLFLRILKQPMKFKDLFARVASSKRKSDLPPEDLERFRWAVEAAVKTAVKAEILSRSSDGLIAVLSTGAKPDGDTEIAPAKKTKSKKPVAE